MIGDFLSLSLSERPVSLDEDCTDDAEFPGIDISPLGIATHSNPLPRCPARKIPIERSFRVTERRVARKTGDSRPQFTTASHRPRPVVSRTRLVHPNQRVPQRLPPIRAAVQANSGVVRGPSPVSTSPTKLHTRRVSKGPKLHSAAEILKVQSSSTVFTCNPMQPTITKGFKDTPTITKGFKNPKRKTMGTDRKSNKRNSTNMESPRKKTKTPRNQAVVTALMRENADLKAHITDMRMHLIQCGRRIQHLEAEKAIMRGMFV
mmetsp:Transcript_26856/g.50155  ORF Transcript_26856/g.50155 Transcript_26856/m.50155 type:complete len:262 (-) Transcript_26856:632-1417(-)|eukprot:CAMPEP_0170199084 /NCGR_PEP_ID=MMETSP0040_2-20121228/69144_1 /TAXON_ID=641309 /ORGANISM="Lotharella oceanica, Strain CCMP622" /LENGTH=261 /DNA_ID=CAMNT_0010449167 /DNA_START=113 /DNA_END=898 /DNA_ORIENTATION=+